MLFHDRFQCAHLLNDCITISIYLEHVTYKYGKKQGLILQNPKKIPQQTGHAIFNN